MTTLSTKNIERVNTEVTANAIGGVVAYAFAIQFTPETVSFVRVPIEKVRTIAPMLKTAGKKIMFKTTREVKAFLKDYDVIFKISTADIEKVADSDNRINRGHAAEMVLFGHDADTSLKSQDKVDGYFNGEFLQLKASLISWSGTSNNGMGSATFVPANR